MRESIKLKTPSLRALRQVPPMRILCRPISLKTLDQKLYIMFHLHRRYVLEFSREAISASHIGICSSSSFESVVSLSRLAVSSWSTAGTASLEWHCLENSLSQYCSPPWCIQASGWTRWIVLSSGWFFGCFSFWHLVGFYGQKRLLYLHPKGWSCNDQKQLR